MEYSEVSSAFSKLVETHFLQRCPPLAGAATKDSATPGTPATPATSGTPAAPVSTAPPTPESFPDCYKVPHVTLTGRGKRQLSGEDGEDQRNAKRAKMDLQVGIWNMLGNFPVPFINCINFGLSFHLSVFVSVSHSLLLRHTATRGFAGR